MWSHVSRFFRLEMLRRVIVHAARGWWTDDVPRLAAALAYYAVFSIAPLLLLSATLAGTLFGPEAVNGQIDAQLSGLVGANTAKDIEAMVLKAYHARDSTLATVIGVITLIYGAMSLFTELTASLNLIWHEPAARNPRKGGVLWQFFQVRLLSLAMILLVGFMLIASLLLSMAMHFLHGWLGAELEVPVDLWAFTGYAISCAGEIVLFALVFRGLTHVKFPWKDVWAGAIFTGVLFEAGKWALGWYLGRSTFSSTYGAAASLMALLVWANYSAIILLTGAEITEAWSVVRQQMKKERKAKSTTPAPA